MLRAAILVSVLAVIVNGQSTAVTQCTNSGGELPINAYIEGCTTPPCRLPRDQDAVIHMVFRAPYTIRRMRTYARALVILAWISYPLGENEEACNFITNSYCPLIQGETVLYTLKMHIDNSFPTITVTIEFRIEDDNNNSFICIRLPVTVVNAVTPNALNGTIAGV